LDSDQHCLKQADVENFNRGICLKRYTCDYDTRVVQDGKIALKGTWTDKKGRWPRSPPRFLHARKLPAERNGRPQRPPDDRHPGSQASQRHLRGGRPGFATPFVVNAF